MAQATRAHRLVLFTATEPSLALGVDRQVELLHLDPDPGRRVEGAGGAPSGHRPGPGAGLPGRGGRPPGGPLAPGADHHILLLDALGQHIQGISVTP